MGLGPVGASVTGPGCFRRLKLSLVLWAGGGLAVLVVTGFFLQGGFRMDGLWDRSVSVASFASNTNTGCVALLGWAGCGSLAILGLFAGVGHVGFISCNLASNTRFSIWCCKRS